MRDSIGAQSSGLEASVGSSDPAAAPQEMGTARLPPRPFLAPAAASLGESVAQAVGAVASAALKGESVDSPIILASGSWAGRGQPAPYANPFGVVVPGAPANEDWTSETYRRLRSLGNLLHSESNSDDAQPQPEPAKPGDATLPEDRRKYILDGDGKGNGGHGPGRTTPNKSVFPSDWSDDQAIGAIRDIANDPSSQRTPGYKENSRKWQPEWDRY